jgi:hypothetical protein
MKHPAAPLIAQDFGRLQHTNDRGETGVLSMPGFTTTGMTPEQAAETVGPLAIGVAEAIIETLDQRYGYLLVQRQELEARSANTVDQGLDGVPIHCSNCRQVVIQRLRLTNPEFVKINPAEVGAVLIEHAKVCRR